MLFLGFYAFSWFLCFFLIFILFADIINVKQQFRHILFRKWGEKGYFIDIYKILLFCLQPQAAYPGKYPRLKSFKGLYETSGTFLPHISTSPLWHNIAIKLWEKLEKLWSLTKFCQKFSALPYGGKWLEISWEGSRTLFRKHVRINTSS